MVNGLALCVGINKFKDPSSTLSGCVNDATNTRTNLMKIGFDSTNIRMLFDERATRLAVYQRVASLADLTAVGQWAVWEQSCHGSQIVCRDGDEVDDKMDEVLCPYDYPDLWDSPDPRTTPDLVDCEAILGAAPKPLICDDDVAIMLKKFKPGAKVFMLIDACHSGTCDREIKKKPKFIRPPLDIEFRGKDRGNMPRRFFGRKRGAVNKSLSENVHYIDQMHVLLSGCRDDQTSADTVEDAMAQGAMTWAWWKALVDLGYYIGKKVTWLEAHAKTLDILKACGYTQVPQLTGQQKMLESPLFS